MSDRPAHITPSQMKRLMPKSGLGKGAESYADEIVINFIGVEIDEYEGYWMKRGNELEPFAREAYMRETLREVHKPDRMVHPDYDYISGEPDGITTNRADGGIEIKCLKWNSHLDNVRYGLQKDKYFYQIQAYMWITGRKWWDFVSYHPEFPEPLDIYIERIERDQETIDLMEERCVEFWEEYVEPRKQELLSKL